MATTREPKREPQIRYRFMESGAEWALLDNGHYRVLRCGDLVADTRVRLTIPGLTHRTGTLLALLAGWGPSPRPVICVVELDLPAQIHYECRAPRRPLRHYRPEHLEVIPG